MAAVTDHRRSAPQLGPRPLTQRITERRSHLDAVSFLTVFVVLLIGLPPQLVVGPLGAVGSPATIVACLGLGWWMLHHAQRPAHGALRRRPVRRAMLVLLFAFLLSYIAAMLRPISLDERSTVQIGLLSICGALGIGLLINDGIPTYERWYRFADRVVIAGGLLAALGVVQFLTDQVLIDRISIPGLVNNGALGVQARGGFPRPAGTALHPIEFGSIITMLLPLAIARGLRLTRSSVFTRWWPPAVIGLGIVVSISRSAVVCAVVGLVVLGSAWPRRAQQALLAASAALVGLVALTIPGILGTMTNLFTDAGAGQDGSVASRTGSYAIAWEFFERSPIIGRGYSTFLPAYRIFDNEYLLLLVEVGVVGLLALVALIIAAGWCARRAHNLSSDHDVRSYAQAVLASVCAGGAVLALFDGLSFPMCTGVLFIVLGLSGSLLRLVQEGEVPWATVAPLVPRDHRSHPDSSEVAP